MRADVTAAAEQHLRSAAEHGWAGYGVGPALPAAQLRDPSGRVRLSGAVCSGPMRTCVRQHYRDLHRGVRRVSQPAAATSARRPGGAHARRSRMTRKMGYRWHLRQLMAARDMFQTSDLVPLLAERGVILSR